MECSFVKCIFQMNDNRLIRIRRRTRDRNIALVTSRYFARVDYFREILASKNLSFFLFFSFFVLSFQTKRNVQRDPLCVRHMKVGWSSNRIISITVSTRKELCDVSENTMFNIRKIRFKFERLSSNSLITRNDTTSDQQFLLSILNKFKSVSLSRSIKYMI